MTDFSQQRIYEHRLLTCFSYLVSVFSGCKWCLLTNCISGAVVVQFRPSPGCLEVSGHDWIKISFLFWLAAVFLSRLFDHTTEFWLLWTRLLQFRLNVELLFAHFEDLCLTVEQQVLLFMLAGGKLNSGCSVRGCPPVFDSGTAAALSEATSMLFELSKVGYSPFFFLKLRLRIRIVYSFFLLDYI